MREGSGPSASASGGGAPRELNNVSDVLRDRSQAQGGFDRTLFVSFAVHAIALAAFVIAPSGWFSRAADDQSPVMTISLGGGGEGPRSGETSIGGRPVQTQTPSEEIKKPEAVRAPAAKTPEMTLPTSKAQARPARTPSPPVTQAPDDARGRTPTKGVETSAGSAVAVTGARGQGFGLSAGGGPGAGARLDVANFCCPDYLTTMIERVRANWNEKQDAPGQAVIRFTIQRDGTLTNATIEQSSGSPILDLAAQRAIALTKQLPPLPTQFPDATLGVHLTFIYQR